MVAIIGIRPNGWNAIAVRLAAGVAGALAITLGDVVWWQYDGAWKGWQVFYEVSSFSILGLVMAAFTAPDGANEGG